MTHPSEQAIRKACEEAGCLGYALTVRESNAILALARRIEASGSAEARVKELEAALSPFADCMECISDDEDDEEWAKFRLLVKDYRRARKALEAGNG